MARCDIMARLVNFFYMVGLIITFALLLPHNSACKIIKVGSGEGYLATISAAVSSASAGDVIRVYSGVYHEEIVVDKPNIVIEGADQHNPPVIDGSDLSFFNSTHSWVKVNNHVYKTSYNWPNKQLTDDQFTEYSGGIGATRVALQVFENGELLRGYRNRHDPDYEGYDVGEGLAGPYRTLPELDPSNDNGKLPIWLRRPGIDIPGRFLYKQDNHELYVWSASDSAPNGKKYNIPVKIQLITINSEGVSLKNLEIKYSGGYAVVLNSADRVTIDHCYLNNNVYGIYVLNSKDTTISNNLIRVKGLWERYWYDDVKATILGSYMVKVDGLNLSSGCRIFNNIISGSYGILTGGQNMKVYHNIISYSPSVLINSSEINESRGAPSVYDHNLQIYDNILHHADFSVIAVSFVSKGNTWFYRNIAYEAKYLIKDGTSYKSQLGSESRGKKYFYHNTVVGFSTLIQNPYTYMAYKKTVLRDNIFYGDIHLYAFYNGNVDYFPFSVGPDSDYNLIWLTGNNELAAFEMGDGSIKYYYKDDFAKFVRETQIELHSKFGLPKLKNVNIVNMQDIDTVTAKDLDEFKRHGFDSVFETGFSSIHNKFSLAENSNAINAGISLSGYPDYIISANVDVGAVKYHDNQSLSKPQNLRMQ